MKEKLKYIATFIGGPMFPIFLQIMIALIGLAGILGFLYGIFKG